MLFIVHTGGPYGISSPIKTKNGKTTSSLLFLLIRLVLFLSLLRMHIFINRHAKLILFVVSGSCV